MEMESVICFIGTEDIYLLLYDVKRSESFTSETVLALLTIKLGVGWTNKTTQSRTEIHLDTYTQVMNHGRKENGMHTVAQKKRKKQNKIADFAWT